MPVAGARPAPSVATDLIILADLVSVTMTLTTAGDDAVTQRFDYIIVGSGIAGLYAALTARQHGSVCVLTKGSIDECNTKYAQGGIAAAIGADDDPELHYQDTLTAGAGLVDPEAARILVDSAADRISDLVTFGVPFDSADGEVALCSAVSRHARHIGFNLLLVALRL